MSSLLQSHTPHVLQSKAFAVKELKMKKNPWTQKPEMKRSNVLLMWFFELDAKILNASISNEPLCVNGELQHFLPNDIGSCEPWLHRDLLCVTVGRLFQSHVSQHRSGSISKTASFSLISWSPENEICPFLLGDVDLGGIPTISAMEEEPRVQTDRYRHTHDDGKLWCFNYQPDTFSGSQKTHRPLELQ